MRGLIVLLAMWACGARCARAEDIVRLFEADGVRSGLCGALRIQFADLGEVRCEREASSSDLPARIQAAARVVREGRARLSLFLERDPLPGRVRMYLVGGRDDEAVIAIESIEDRKEPDVDRALALKAREALDTMEIVSRAQQSQDPPKMAGVIAPQRSPEATPGEPDLAAPNWSGVFEAGGGVLAGGDGSPRAAGRALLGARLRFAELGTELAAGARFHADTNERASAGIVDESEWGPTLSLRALWTARSFEFGAFAEATWLIMSARGTTASGARGEKSQGTPAFGLGLEARVRLSQLLFLRLAPALELLSIAQRFAVDDRVTMNLGRVRVLVPISGVVALPLGDGR